MQDTVFCYLVVSRSCSTPSYLFSVYSSALYYISIESSWLQLLVSILGHVRWSAGTAALTGTATSDMVLYFASIFIPPIGP